MENGIIFTPGPWSYSPQEGEPGHCEQAQVWSGDAVLACIEPERNPAEATGNAVLMASAPTMYDVLRAIDREGHDANRDGDVTIPSNIWEAVKIVLGAVQSAAEKR